jgi:hypothetical protein
LQRGHESTGSAASHLQTSLPYTANTPSELHGGALQMQWAKHALAPHILSPKKPNQKLQADDIIDPPLFFFLALVFGLAAD